MTSVAETAKELRTWFLNYIQYFRNEYGKLSRDEQKFIDVSSNYLSPCQIEVFWLKFPEHQLVVKTNFHDRKDLEITIHGPYESNEFVLQTEAILSEPRWSRRLGKSYSYGQEDYGHAIAASIHQLMQEAKRGLFSEQSFRGTSSGGQMGDDLYVTNYYGNAAELDYVAQVNGSIQQIRAQYQFSLQNSVSVVDSSVQDDSVEGFGVYFYPAIALENTGTRSIGEILRGQSIGWDDNKSFDMTFFGNMVVVNKDGFMFLGVSKKELALKMINTIMAVGTLYDLGFFAVREHELAKGVYDKNSLTHRSLGWSYSTIRSVLFDRSGSGVAYYGKRFVESSTLMKIIQEAEGIFSNQSLVEELRLLVEAHTHLNDAEYAQSFVMSWSIIERSLSNMWRSKLYVQNLDSERLGKLLDNNRWSIDTLLEILNLHDEISESEYDLYMEMKGKRNKFIHQGKQIASEDARRIFELAKEIVFKKMPTKV